jgi:hypothetical protein
MASERGTDFETRAFPYFKDGLLDLESFREVTGFTEEEVRAYCHQRGWYVD